MTKMKSLSSLGLGLSVVFGCLFLALIAELYYLLWWKKRFASREIENDYSSPQKEIFYMFCWRRSSSLCHTAPRPRELCAQLRMADTLVHEPNAPHQLHVHTSSNNLVLKQFEEDELDAELTRLQNAAGPPRHLFTIVEETKEDLESEDGRSRGGRSQKGSRSKSLSDLLVTVETPYLTPLGSPTLSTPPLTPVDSQESQHNQHGFNPLFESKTDAEFNRLRSSPPPRFKFLQAAEEKLRVKLKEEEAQKGLHKIDGKVHQIENKAPPSPISRLLKDEEDGSFITIIVDKNKERELNHHNHNHHPHLPQHHSSTSQVLPLASSPSAFRSPLNKKPTLH